MKIKFYKADELLRPFRLTVHKSGKLGFTSEAAKELDLTSEKSISIGKNEDDPADDRLYMVVNNRVEPGAFKVAKAGPYYYLPIKVLLDNLSIPYASEMVAFSMEKFEEGGGTYYRLTRIGSKKRSGKTDPEQ